MQQKKTIELLAPAKNIETGMAAINYGADAVYIGAPKFGARAAAGNTLNDIEQLVKYAHQYWAKVYVTFNTILYDNELDEAEKLIHQLYEIGVDALIIQDLGILEMNLPPIELHASTQTHNYDLNRIQFLEQVGFKRIILARELSLTQLQEIRKHTSCELEYFVHGALCVSLSGQCYFSQATTNRSANRGACSQACRMKYNLIDDNGNILAKDKYLLSLKDLNLSAHLQEIINSGICSLKIEGRLKDSTYLKNITSHYRKHINNVLKTNPQITPVASGNTKISFNPDPDITFNRGYTNYFFNGRTNHIANYNTPKAMGKQIGRVTKINKDNFTVDTKEQLNNGDGLCFIDKQGTLRGFQVNRVEKNKIYPNDIRLLQQGVTLFRNNNHQFTKLLKNDHSIRKIATELFVDFYDNTLSITAIDENEIAANIQHSKSFELAKNKDMAMNNIQKQLQKSGDTIFDIYHVHINMDNIPFIPAKQLNELRRKCLEQLLANRLSAYPANHQAMDIKHPKYPQEQLSYRGNVTNKKAEDFYKKCGVTQIEKGFEIQKSYTGKLLMVTRHCLRHDFGICLKHHKAGRGDNRKLFLEDNNHRYALEFDCKRCEMKILASSNISTSIKRNLLLWNIISRNASKRANINNKTLSFVSPIQEK